MDLATLASYAKSHGASRQAATKWKKAGALVFDGDSVDVAASDDRMRGLGLGRFKASGSASGPVNRARSTRRKVDAPSVDALAAAVVDDGELVGFIDDLLAGRFKSKVDAEAIKENALALKHLLAARREAGLIVDIDVAEKVLFEDARRARDAWLNFTTRIGPLLAADLGIEQERLIDALAPYVHQQLTDLGEPRADFAAS